MNKSFWSGKRVLITGHTGFKGSWLSLWLQSLGAELAGYSLPPLTNPSLFNIAKVDSYMASFIGDIRNLDGLQSVFKKTNPEIVIHMAAQPLVRYSYQNPVETYEVNVMGTVNLLEAVRNSDYVKSVVVVTTDKCYENREWVWGYRESDSMGGYDPYSNSKGCAELVCSAYRSSFFNPNEYNKNCVALATARAGNVIGGGDWAQDRLIPDLLYSFGIGKEAFIRYPNSVRPWQHVMEPLLGYLCLAEKLFSQGADFAEAWNFGPNSEDCRSVGWVADRLSEIWGGGAKWRTNSGVHPHEAQYLKLEISKARSKLGWKPQLRLEDGLSLVIEWEQNRLAGANMRELTLAQLMAYQELNKETVLAPEKRTS